MLTKEILLIASVIFSGISGRHTQNSNQIVSFLTEKINSYQTLLNGNKCTYKLWQVKRSSTPLLRLQCHLNDITTKCRRNEVVEQSSEN